jgi:hypothetical protein
MSIQTVEIRAYSGPDLVTLQGTGRPAIVRLNVGPAGPAGPNSVTSATTSDGTCDLSLDTLVVGTGTASGVNSVAIGTESTSSGFASLSVGFNALASGDHSVAIGSNVEASGYASYASGDLSIATADYSRAVGVYARAIHIGASVESDSQNVEVESFGVDTKVMSFAGGYQFLGGGATFVGEGCLFEQPLTVNGLICSGDLSVTGTLTADHIHGNLAGSVYAHVRAGENLAKGDPVYISGSHGSGSTLIPIVSKADASNAAKMPAVGIMDAALANNANGHMVITGTITDLDTNAYAVNSVLYVATGGGFTATPPAANSQPVAIVERANANNGAIIVKVNGLASSGGNGASDANKLVRFTSTGTIPVVSIGGLGTGVATALAVNTGSAGAFVVNGGTATDMTLAGSAAFTSTTRPTSAGTGTPGATSLITRADADARFGGEMLLSRLTTDGAAIQSQTTLQDTGCSVALGVGTWEISAITNVTNATSTAQGKVAVSVSGGTSSHEYGLVMWSIAAVGVPSHDNLNWLTATRVYGNAARYWARYEGIVVVSAGTTTIKTQYAQNVSTAADTIVKANSYIIARKIA